MADTLKETIADAQYVGKALNGIKHQLAKRAEAREIDKKIKDDVEAAFANGKPYTFDAAVALGLGTGE